MSNRLAASTSPYLLQHAENPVDWWPWCDEAFAEARRLDVPVLLSVGYAACHWCHVMAHESFEDEAVAAALAGRFVAIKVDREERPDVDTVYMSATVALTGRGGWPMTCLLTPDADPFFAGTYLPKAHFLHLLDSAADAWENRRAEVVESGARIADALRQQAAGAAGIPGVAGAGAQLLGDAGEGVPVGADALDRAEAAIAGTADWRRGGFGGAPKFPPSMVLQWLLAHHARTGTPRALQMVAETCEVMARGGMYDQLGGGFARYAVDADWVVPHFEKMLYDNAQLLRAYAHWHAATGSPTARRIVVETVEFLRRDLRTPQGAFASALDADAAGVEGLTYAWTPAQLREVLGETDGAAAALLLRVTDAGTFEHGASTLQLREDPADPVWWADVRARLLSARGGRPQPARDDKVVTAWNGLAVGALADAGAILGEPGYVEDARVCATFLIEEHLVDGRLRRTSRDGVVGEALGVAEDYGNLAHGLVRLHAATGEGIWLDAAGALLDAAAGLFEAPDGGFYDTGHDAPALLLRPRSDTDNAEPGGPSSLSTALLAYGAAAGSSAHLSAAHAAIRAGATTALRAPRFGGWTLAAAESALAGPLQVAIVVPPGDPGAGADLLAAAHRHAGPEAIVVAGEPDAPGVPVLAGRPLVDGRAAAYVCRGTVCDAPVTSAAELTAALSPAPAAP